MKKRGFLYFFAIVIAILYIFRNWFLSREIIGGDWPYYYNDFLKNFTLVPIIWQPWLGNGLGSVQPLLGFHVFGSLIVVIFTQWLHIPWNIAYKIGWFGFFLFLSGFSIASLSRHFLQKFDPLYWLSILLYTANTYILMVTSGGQMGVALAYALAPLVIERFIVFTMKIQVKNSIFAGLVLAFQMLLDPRIAYVTIIALGIYTLISFYQWETYRRNFLFGMGIIAVVVFALNFFWIFPLAVSPVGTIGLTGGVYTSVRAVKFFSFADFSHALSLLHPNWPENIFGKSYFLQPEFLLIPFFAFASLIFINQRKNGQVAVTYFALLGIVGAFLAKGANEPFGSLYLWAFTHIPGFIMFRDPTKFYLLVAVSYSILIPFTLEQSLIFFKKSKSTSYIILIPIFALVVWGVLIRQALRGELKGTFVSREVPKEYTDLAAFLKSQDEDFRTLWVPRQQRFSYDSLQHMSVEAEPLFEATTVALLKERLSMSSSQELLADLGIKYVIVPYDSLGELFLADRHYDERIRRFYELMLDTMPWLKKIQTGKLTIYETTQHEKKFFIPSKRSVSYVRQSMDRYVVRTDADIPLRVVFSEQYHPGWVFQSSTKKIYAQKRTDGLMEFLFDTPGRYDGVVYFEPQRYVPIGLFVSTVTLMGIICIIILA